MRHRLRPNRDRSIPAREGLRGRWAAGEASSRRFQIPVLGCRIEACVSALNAKFYVATRVC